MLQRGEGVAVVLDPVMHQAWHDAGKSWLPVNSRIMSVCMQLSDNYLSGSQQCVYIVSEYALTYRAPAEVKENFLR